MFLLNVTANKINIKSQPKGIVMPVSKPLGAKKIGIIISVIASLVPLIAGKTPVDIPLFKNTTMKEVKNHIIRILSMIL